MHTGEIGDPKRGRSENFLGNARDIRHKGVGGEVFPGTQPPIIAGTVMKKAGQVPLSGLLSLRFFG
jgi:hypothetical protein